MFNIYKKVDNNGMVGKLFDITNKYNTTYNILIVLNIIFFVIAWDRDDMFIPSALIMMLTALWLIFTMAIGTNNMWKDYLFNNIMLNYRFLLFVNTLYIILISIAIGYGLYNII